jgi:hypothetical protein
MAAGLSGVIVQTARAAREAEDVAQGGFSLVAWLLALSPSLHIMLCFTFDSIYFKALIVSGVHFGQ